jgi:hypothetical protein
MVVSTEQVLNDFKSNLDMDNAYSLKDLQKLLETSYKKFNKGKGSSANKETKKPPSPYNIFIKEEIAKMKEEKLEGVDPKDYMKLAAQRWQEHKTKV